MTYFYRRYTHKAYDGIFLGYFHNDSQNFYKLNLA